MDSTKPKLVYFEMYGRGEPIRLLFSFFKIDYEDILIPYEGFKNEKQKYKYGKVPVVEMDGMVMPQNRAVLRYLCLKNGHHPTDPVPNYQVNQLLDHFYDFETAFYVATYYRPKQERPELTEKYFATTFPQTLAVLEKTLKDNVSQEYLVGDKLTAADVVFVDFIYSQVFNPNHGDRDVVGRQVLKKFPLFSAFVEKRKSDFPRLDDRPNWLL